MNVQYKAVLECSGRIYSVRRCDIKSSEILNGEHGTVEELLIRWFKIR